MKSCDDPHKIYSLENYIILYIYIIKYGWMISSRVISISTLNNSDMEGVEKVYVHRQSLLI